MAKKKVAEKEIKYLPQEESHEFAIIKIVAAKPDKEPAVSPTRSIEVVIKAHNLKPNFFYDVCMVPNLAALDRKIKNEQAAKLQFESQEQEMIDDLKIAEIQKFDDRIAELKVAKEDMEKNFPNIFFAAQIAKIDDTKQYPKLEMIVSKDVCTELNECYESLGNYLIQLQIQNHEENNAAATK